MLLQKSAGRRIEALRQAEREGGGGGGGSSSSSSGIGGPSNLKGDPGSSSRSSSQFYDPRDRSIRTGNGQVDARAPPLSWQSDSSSSRPFPLNGGEGGVGRQGNGGPDSHHYGGSPQIPNLPSHHSRWSTGAGPPPPPPNGPYLPPPPSAIREGEGSSFYVNRYSRDPNTSSSSSSSVVPTASASSWGPISGRPSLEHQRSAPTVNGTSRHQSLQPPSVLSQQQPQQQQMYQQSQQYQSQPQPPPPSSIATADHHLLSSGNLAHQRGISFADQHSEYSAPPAPSSVASTSNLTLEHAIPNEDILRSILPPFSTSMADSLFDEKGIFDSQAFFSDPNPPLLIATGEGQPSMLELLGACAPSGETPGSVASSGLDSANALQGHHEEEDQPHPLSDSVLIPTLALFYERLGGVMPVFSRTWLFSRMDRDDQHNDAQFAAMLMAMSALTLIQVQPEDKEKRQSSRKRRQRAVQLLEEALKMREGLFMGQTPTLEATCTSFFVFAALFGLGEHSAAWYRLREAVTLGHLCKLHEPASYEHLPKDEAERRLRAYWLLAITERAFAIQRGMPITLTGNPRASTAGLRARLGIKELSDFPDLQLRLFDVVDEKFVDCWNRRCVGEGCRNFDRDRALALWEAFADSDIAVGKDMDSNNTGFAAGQYEGGARDAAGGGGYFGRTATKNTSASGGTTTSLDKQPLLRSQVQRADVEVTRHWLLNRLWLITLSHGLLSIDAVEPPLRIDHAIHVARSALDVCSSLSLLAMEAHGVGFTYKLYDIAQTLIMLCKDESIAAAISASAANGMGNATSGGIPSTVSHTSTSTGHGSALGRGHLQQQQQSSPSMSERSTGARSATNLNGTQASPPNSATSANGQTPNSTTSSLSSSATLLNASISSGPQSLRNAVSLILRDFLILFKRFRQGDHPYLDLLVKAVKDLKREEWDSRPFDDIVNEIGLSNESNNDLPPTAEEAKRGAEHQHQHQHQMPHQMPIREGFQ